MNVPAIRYHLQSEGALSIPPLSLFRDPLFFRFSVTFFVTRSQISFKRFLSMVLPLADLCFPFAIFFVRLPHLSLLIAVKVGTAPSHLRSIPLLPRRTVDLRLLSPSRTALCVGRPHSSVLLSPYLTSFLIHGLCKSFGPSPVFPPALAHYPFFG